MRIGELAKKAGVNIQTLRYYEREGLLPDPMRTNAGYREYSQADLDRLLLIRSSQEIGFTLKDIREVLELHRVLAQPAGPETRKPAAQAQLLAAANARLASIEQKLSLLSQMKSEMNALIATLEGNAKPICPYSGQELA
jgi:DNA-binding transcriptional MerR regulator